MQINRIDSEYLSNNLPRSTNHKFRVENRRARPVISKQSNGEEGSKYFSQQAT